MATRATWAYSLLFLGFLAIVLDIDLGLDGSVDHQPDSLWSLFCLDHCRHSALGLVFIMLVSRLARLGKLMWYLAFKEGQDIPQSGVLAIGAQGGVVISHL